MRLSKFYILSLIFALFFIPFLGLHITASNANDAIETVTQDIKETAHIKGFRGAEFDMNIDDTIASIKKDFELTDEQIIHGENSVTRTKSLSITVNDLIADTGTAFVSYIFGHKSQGLIQINIVWNSLEDETQTPETILGIGGSLQHYFLKQNFDVDKIVTGIRVDDKTVMLLKATDRQGRMAGLILEGLSNEIHNETPHLLLKMSYQKDPENPDIYIVPEGDF